MVVEVVVSVDVFVVADVFVVVDDGNNSGHDHDLARLSRDYGVCKGGDRHTSSLAFFVPK